MSMDSEAGAVPDRNFTKLRHAAEAVMERNPILATRLLRQALREAVDDPTLSDETLVEECALIHDALGVGWGRVAEMAEERDLDDYATFAGTRAAGHERRAAELLVGQDDPSRGVS